MADTRICLHVVRLLRTRLCLLFPGPGILSQSCSEGMELVLVFPFPPLIPSVLAQSSGKVVFLGLRSEAAVQGQPGKSSQVWTVTRGWEGTRFEWAVHWHCFLVKHTACSAAPNSPGGSSREMQGAQLSQCVLAPGKQAMSGTASAPVQGAHAA